MSGGGGYGGTNLNPIFCITSPVQRGVCVERWLLCIHQAKCLTRGPWTDDDLWESPTVVIGPAADPSGVAVRPPRELLTPSVGAECKTGFQGVTDEETTAGRI